MDMETLSSRLIRRRRLGGCGEYDTNALIRARSTGPHSIHNLKPWSISGPWSRAGLAMHKDRTAKREEGSSPSAGHGRGRGRGRGRDGASVRTKGEARVEQH